MVLHIRMCVGQDSVWNQRFDPAQLVLISFGLKGKSGEFRNTTHCRVGYYDMDLVPQTKYELEALKPLRG